MSRTTFTVPCMLIRLDMHIRDTVAAHHLCGLYAYIYAYCRLPFLCFYHVGEMKVRVNPLRVRIANPQVDYDFYTYAPENELLQR